ncbi:flagellar basal body P-ring formation chaperone FlgA [Natroniella sulfidigena]|uniref:flagellar basal body P-ring formation chaperone FlgA n=1 Tax=Natroniella sulfidigena TaxID=723921 RepID=UPI00200B727D|nr:flagellar basal body P-ring formation chaperone FlgA [Natroniella sulfidigena]MCK8816382.1 flagellar basal body P-ring formation chaperone FlgA [Natroniella sulfidigena]
MKKELISLLVGLLILLVSTSVLATENIIEVTNQVEVTGTEIRLVEIAQIKGDSEFKSNLKSITLGQAPLPGYQRVIYRTNVINALRREEIDPEQIRTNIPYHFSVTTDYKKLSADKLVQLGKDYIYQELGQEPEQVEIEVRNSPQDLKYPTGELQLEVGNLHRRNLLGRTMLPIEVKVDGSLYRRVNIQYEVSLWQEVLVAEEDIESRTELSHDLFQLEDKLLTTQNNDFVAKDYPLDGTQLRSSLRSGQPLEVRMIDRPPLVGRWEDVKLIAQIGGVIITADGRSREAGHYGDIIKVENKNTRKIIEGKIIGERKVQVITD